MSFPIQIVFLGIVAFVPGATGYIALLPDLSAGQYASDGCRLGEHESLMLIDAESCTLGGVACPRVNEAPCPVQRVVAGAVFLIPLKQRDLAISFPAPASTQPAPPPVQHTPPRRFGKVPGDKKEAQDLHWLPTPGGGWVNPDCLKPAGRDNTCPMAARITIENSVPQVCHLLTDSDQNVCSFRFRPNHELWPFGEPVQAIADGVMVSGDSTGMRLTLTAFGSVAPQDLLLTPAPGRGVRIWIGEIALSDSAAPGDFCATQAARGRHFETYYNLVAVDSDGSPLALGRRLSPAETAECSSTDVQPEALCPEAPRPRSVGDLSATCRHGVHEPFHAISDVSACGHNGQTMLAPPPAVRP